MLPPSKKYEPVLPVYNDKFENALNKVRLVLKDYQHSLSIIQKEENGASTSLEILITLKK